MVPPPLGRPADHSHDLDIGYPDSAITLEDRL
jgi:hypothetical protein